MKPLNANYALVTAPTSEPIPPEDWEILKLHVRVDTDDDEMLLRDYVKAARAYLEKITNIMLMYQTWDLFLDYFPSTIEIKKRPITSIVSVKYYDANNALQTLDTALYQTDLNSIYARIAPVQGETWPTTKERYGAVLVRFSGGASRGDEIDPVLCQALKLHVAHLYANREPVSDKAMEKVPLGYDSLVSTERVIPV